MLSIRRILRKYLLNNLSIKGIFNKNYIRFQEYKFFKFKKKLKYFESGYFKLTPFISEKELIDYYKLKYRSLKSNFVNRIIDDRAVLHYNFIHQFIDKSQINFLNIGSSNGGLSHLLHANEKINIFNHDLHKVKNYYSKRWNYLDSLENLDIKFDLIYMSHSLEHVADLDIFFKRVNKIIHEKTKIFIEVPNAKHPLTGNFGKEILPPHTHYFEKKFFESINQKKLFLFLTNKKTIDNQNTYSLEEGYDVDESSFKFIIYLGEGYFNTK